MRVVIAPFNRMNDSTLAGVRAAGHEVLCTGTEVLSYPEIEAQYPAGWRPDVFIFWSPEYHPVPRGLESAPCLKVGVFGDWNLGGQSAQQSASMFDLLFADVNGAACLRDLGFDKVVSAPLWSFDPDLHRRIPNIERDIDILLVGNFNHDIQHERSRWLGRVARLSTRHKVLLASGVFSEPYAQLLNRAKIVFNRSIRGEINMRAYEAPACGALLFYERGNREIGSLFADRRECVLYGEDDLEDLLDYYLAHDDERNAIAKAGNRRVQLETPSRHLGDMFDAIGAALNSGTERRAQDILRIPTAEQELRIVRQWLLSSDVNCLGAADSALQRAEAAGGDLAVIAGLRAYLLAQAGKFLPGIDQSQAYVEALHLWQAAALIEPECASTRLNMALMLAEIGMPAEAEVQARAVRDLLDRDPVSAIAPGALYWPCRFTAFGVEYDRIEIRCAHGSEAWIHAMRKLLRWRASELLTDIAFMSERFGDAVDFAAEAASLMPQVAATQFRHGRALNALGSLNEAIAAYRTALDINPFLGEARTALVNALIAAGLPQSAQAAVRDCAAIVSGCPVYSSQLTECEGARLAAQSSGSSVVGAPEMVYRMLAFPDWRRPVTWQELVGAYAGRVCPEPDLLMLWADPAQYEPALLLRQVAAYLTSYLRLQPSDFPNVTIVSQAFAPHERWKLFQAANAVLDCGPMPEIFRDVFNASHLPVVSLVDTCRYAA